MSLPRSSSRETMAGSGLKAAGVEGDAARAAGKSQVGAPVDEQGRHGGVGVHGGRDVQRAAPVDSLALDVSAPVQEQCGDVGVRVESPGQVQGPGPGVNVGGFEVRAGVQQQGDGVGVGAVGGGDVQGHAAEFAVNHRQVGAAGQFALDVGRGGGSPERSIA